MRSPGPRRGRGPVDGAGRPVLAAVVRTVAAAPALALACSLALPALAALPGAVGRAEAQQVPAPADTQQAPLPDPIDISPGGAFWRALIFPGWGHAAIDAHQRGGFYFAAQGATIYTLLRTRIRVGEAQDRVRFREAVLRQRLADEGVTDTDLVDERMDQDATLGELRGLLDSRKEQQEDMVALGIFVLFLSGADAYVSAHLARFPEPLELEARPGPGGTMDLMLRVALPR